MVTCQVENYRFQLDFKGVNKTNKFEVSAKLFTAPFTAVLSRFYPRVQRSKNRVLRTIQLSCRILLRFTPGPPPRFTSSCGVIAFPAQHIKAPIERIEHCAEKSTTHKWQVINYRLDFQPFCESGSWAVVSPLTKRTEIEPSGKLPGSTCRVLFSFKVIPLK